MEIFEETVETLEVDEIIETGKKEKKKTTFKDEAIDFLKTFVIVAVVAFLVRTFVFNFADVEGNSMEPTLQHGDRLLVWQLFYQPSLFDVVIIEHDGGELHVKRILGTPGDRVDYINGEMVINGEVINEEYVFDTLSLNGFVLEQICQFDDCDVIPEDYFLVLGDNRNGSGDSRVYGLIHREQILGRNILRISPLSNFGSFD